MAADNEKWVNFVWKRFLAAKELRGISIRTLVDHKDKGGIGCSEKTIRRAKEKGKIKAVNLEAIAQALDVEPAYLMGKYDEKFGKLFPEPHDEEIEAFLESMLRPERFPYYFSCERNDRYERYLDSILTLHDISRRQYNDLPEEKRRQFMLEIENAVCPVIQKFFTHDARGQEGLPDLYRIVAEIECYDPRRRWRHLQGTGPFPTFSSGTSGGGTAPTAQAPLPPAAAVLPACPWSSWD